MADPTRPPDVSSRTSRSALLIVFLVVVIDLLGFGIVLPLLPRFGKVYVADLLGLAPGVETTTQGAIVGMLMASFSLMQFFFAPLWGRLSDRIGRRPVLLIGLVGSVVFYLLFGYALDLPGEQARLALILLFVARIGQGIAGATISTAQAVIADCTPPDKRKQGMALIGAAFGIGFTVGPLVGFASLFFFPEHHGVIGYVAGGLSLVALILGVLLLQETRDFLSAPPLVRKWLDFSALRHALGSPAVAPVVLIFFMATLGFASFEVTLSLLNKDALGLKDDYNFLIFAYVGFVLMLTQGWLYRRLAKTMTEPALMTVGILLMGLGVLSLAGISLAALQQSLPFVPLLVLQLLSLTFSVVGFAFLTPSAQALISRRTDADRQGEVLGVNQSASALARILGPIMGLSLYSATTSHLLPYLFGGVLLLLMLPVMPAVRRGDPSVLPGH